MQLIGLVCARRVTESMRPSDRSLFLLLPVWLAVRMALNAIDGMLAREFGQKSRLGGYLNELCDRRSRRGSAAAVRLAVAPFVQIAVFAVIGLAGLAEYAGVMGPLVGASRRYDGPLGKSDRAALVGALALWIGLGLPLPPWDGVGHAHGRFALDPDRHQPRPARPPGGPVPMRPVPMRIVEEGQFTTHDGTALFYRRWPAAAAPRAAPSCSSIAAMSTAAAWRMLSTSSTCPTSSSTPGTHAATAARRASAATRPLLRRRPACATVRNALRRAHHAHARHRARAHGSDRAVGRRRDRRHLGARLRADGAGDGAGLAGLPGEALRALCACPAWRCSRSCAAISSCNRM